MEVNPGSPKAENEIEQKKDIKAKNVEFKKPILVGKIGKLPKKITSVPQQVEIVSENIEIADNVEVTEKEIVENVVDDENQIKQYMKSKSEEQLVPYSEPSWSGLPPNISDTKYYFEVLKDGAIIDTISLIDKTFWTFGRHIKCDVLMHHPTISRFHAVLQYRKERDENNESGFYIYDLGSTHGTFLNKKRIKPKVYGRIQVGHMLKFGASTRNFLLNGPEDDTEKESELTVTELKQKREEEIQRIENKKREESLRLQLEEEERKRIEEERGIDWGMSEDADEMTDLSENPFAQTTNEELYLDDPKKTLRGYFEREGLDLEYNCTEQGMGQFLCKVQLPIDDEKGRPLYAEALHKGKKKDAVIQCALEACRLLDRHGLLRQAVHESRKRKSKDWAENDYYDSDDDTFLDRTGTIEKKREKRMNAKMPQKAETYESLLEKEQNLNQSIKKVECQLKEAENKLQLTSSSVANVEDSLDAFMEDLKKDKPGKGTINKLKNELTRLKQDHAKILKLVNIARPTNLPPLVAQYASDTNQKTSGKSKLLPLFGKRIKVPVWVPQKTMDSVFIASNDDQEEEEEEMEQEDTEMKKEESSLQLEIQKTNEPSGLPEENSQYGLIKLKSDEEQISRGKDRQNINNKTLDKCRAEIDKIQEDFKRVSTEIASQNDENLRQQNFETLSRVMTDVTTYFRKNLQKIVSEKMPENKVREKSSPANEPVVINGLDQMARKKKNERRILSRQEKAEIEKQKGYMADAEKEDYNMWMPPPDQKGDGKTKLNEKYGY